MFAAGRERSSGRVGPAGMTASRALPDPGRLAVAMVIEKYPPFIGGAERQARLLAGWLSPHLDRCHVVTAQSGAESDAAAPVRRLGTSRGDGARHAINFAAAFRHFLTHGHCYAVVHGHALSGLVCGAALAARLRDCAIVLKICSVGPHGDVAKLRGHRLGRSLWPLLRRVGVFVVPTPALVGELLTGGVPAPRIAVIPNAVAPAPASADSKGAAREELGLPDRPTALFVGRLVPGKGLDLLPRAWEKTAAGLEATLAIVGDGPESRRVADWAKTSAAAPSIRLFGARVDVDRFYRAADVLVAPSHTETFGNVVAEAMAHGLAVVTTPVGLATHWIRDGENAVLVRGEEPAELGAVLVRLLRDASLRVRLGEAARRDATQSFSPDAVADQYVHLYRRLVAGTPLPGAA